MRAGRDSYAYCKIPLIGCIPLLYSAKTVKFHIDVSKNDCDMRLNTATNEQRTARQGAFSLLELLISVFVMAILFAGMFSGVSTTFKLLQNTRENVRATQVMLSRLERLRLCAWSSGQLFNTNIVPVNFTDYFDPLGLKGTTNTGTVYTGTMVVTTNPVLSPAASYAPNMAQVTISIAWTNGVNGVTNIHYRSMSTYVSEYGMQNYIYYH